jgi:hypothetical protein
MFNLKICCGLPNVMGAIDGTCISIAKPFVAYSKDYFFSQDREVQCGCTSGGWQPKEVYGCLCGIA